MTKKLLIGIILLIIVGAGFLFFMVPFTNDTDNTGEVEEDAAATEDPLTSDDIAQPGSVVHDQPYIFGNVGGQYMALVPAGWYAHELEPQVTVFTQSEELEIPEDTDGYASGPVITVGISSITDMSGVTTQKEWLAVNGFDKENDESGRIQKYETVTVSGLDMIRVVRDATGVEGTVINYIYFMDNAMVVVISHFSYVPGSAETTDFESFIANYNDRTRISTESTFDTKVVYGTEELGEEDSTLLENDCVIRGGVFNSCGSPCDADAEVCTEVCAYTCEGL